MNFILIYICLITCYSKNAYADQNPEEFSEITAGNCSEAKDSDMVYHEVVTRANIPFISRNVTSTWYGDSRLFCVKIVNEYYRQNGKGGGTVILKQGGVGHFFVVLEMHSETGGPLSFLIFLYGKKPQ
ncbi:hypothetical protein ABEB36_004325 [Hypothenemus hampei]|uniref:Uncharacterized protein n=1 Tax=Hypothenemus hampei TaxID=57062 RepID=A0ABD1F3B5_HYPHA